VVPDRRRGDIDPDGILQITDRSKDVISSGAGDQLDHLECIAMAHPAIAESGGDRISIRSGRAADRRRREEARQEVSKEELLKFYEGKIAKWWMPDDVVFVTELPHTATGKLSKLTLRQKFTEYRLPRT